MELEVTRETSASPATAWAVLTDLEASPQVLSGVTSVERLDGGDGFSPGTRWRETREFGGKQASEELEVTAVDEGRSYTVEAESRGTRFRSVVTVEPSDGGALLRMTFGADAGSSRVARLLARTVGRAFEGATRKALQQDLDDVAEAAEALEATEAADGDA